MNVPKVETANNATRIANIDAPGGGQICLDGATAHVALDRPRGMKIIEYSGPSGAQPPSSSENDFALLTILGANMDIVPKPKVEREEELKKS